jgi:hypothetical protein
VIAVKNQLLQHKNKQLREALVNEKKRRQRGKPLLLQAPEEYNGGAIFWSPSKVQDARDRQHQKEVDSQLQQHQKSEESKRREQLKQEKAAMLEERKQQRQIAKEIRLQEQREKAEKREEKRIARQAEQQLQKDIKLSKKGKQKAPLAPPQSSYEIEVIDTTQLSVQGGVPAAELSTRTRSVRLPQRYRI